MKYIVIIAAALLFFVILEMIREYVSFRVTHYDILPEKVKRTDKKHRILFLSDLHNRVYGEGNVRLLNVIKQEKPELILIGGDMLIGKNGYDFQPALCFVKSLADVCPVYYANGNHEQRMKEKPRQYDLSYRQYKQELTDVGIQFLENRSQEIMLGKMHFYITGLEIPAACYSRFHERKLMKEELIQRIGECPADGYQILLAHNPSYMEEYLAWGADLVLSGHFHGGIVRVPGLGGMISPGFHLFPKYSGGIYHKRKQTAVVSKGLGSHTIPVRLFNPAEIVVLDISEA